MLSLNKRVRDTTENDAGPFGEMIEGEGKSPYVHAEEKERM